MASEAMLGELLREFRTAAGLTQGALAEKAGLSEQAVSLLERGTRRRPRVSTVRALAEALGLDPQQEQRLSAAAKGSGTPQPVQAATELSSLIVAPRQLPPTLADFTGRGAELDTLLSTLVGEQHTGIVRMAAVTGMGGVGKTSLAVHAAHLTVDHYPDGHLYIDLRGYGPGEPIQPRDALTQLLRSLGFDSQSIPETVDEAAALYRSRLAGLRILVLLDNANGAAQVRQLLPGAPGAAVVVTSRRSLTTLPGFVQVRLTPLTESDSISLLGKMVGESRVATETAAVRTISRLTGRLPLAVRLIGARLAARPAWPIEHVTDQLRDEQRRLDELGTGHNGVRSNIAASVEFLATSDQLVERQAATALDFLGLPNGTELVTITTAHLLGESEHHTEEMLERLVDLNLLESTAPGRYHLHDLIQAYAREQSSQRLSEGTRTDALSRVLVFYTGLAWRCQQATHREGSRLAMAGDSLRTVPEVTDVNAVLRWFDTEWTNLTGAFHQAQRIPALRSLLPELTLALFGYFEARASWTEMRALLVIGRQIAGELNQQRLAAWLEHDLGIPSAEENAREESLTHFQDALTLFREIGDPIGQARAASSVSHLLEQLGRLDEAVESAEESLELSQRIGDHALEGLSYLALGTLYSRRGDTVLADRAFNRSIALATMSGSERSLGKRYQVAADSHALAGQLPQAVELMTKALSTFERLSDENGRSESHSRLSTFYLELGDVAEARRNAEAGAALARALGNHQREGEALIALGKIEQATEQLGAARTHWRAAATLLHSQSPHQEAIALTLLAQTE
ncbi:XRE family transcriptional regulator [Kribbella italica]|uniref:Transcriptional regulator with XRE-family HTH domain/tetratricopeptide (TPR) repeat protein n=1 Tax=Kribbella italica TaxID=1540520 RepID=A0A7W9J8U5_9ACTN|nr:XRE family transcriptional regulator [Kribbella italica]MBB5837028.1 transcriptional regulator with XRE-family HTH domain/tetratricopeptide (TPR) repeat protein [Kribbella italica]